MMIDKEQTGKRIAVLRKKLGFSQASLAEKVGVTTQAVSKWETGLALPDVDILLELSWLFEISINNLLEGYEIFSNSSALTRTKLPEGIDKLLDKREDKRFVSSLLPYFSEAEIYSLTNQIAREGIAIKLNITAVNKKDNQEISCAVPLASLQDNSLRELAPVISECVNELVGNVDRGLRRIADFLICPQCKSKLKLNTSKGVDNLFYECEEGHKFEVIEGVIYFGSREIPGELWSLSLRNYDHYLSWQQAPHNPIYFRGKVKNSDVMWSEIEKHRPRIILDIASGMGGGVGYFINKINWPCMIILTDLSHRILKWNKKYFLEEIRNPFVDMVYIACDCSNIPVSDNSIDMVISWAGFESMQHKFMDGFNEAYRILKQNSHTVYSMSIVGDHSSYNTQKWIQLLHTTGYKPDLYDISMWLDVCKNTGYKDTFVHKIYGELPAPETDVFPFENEILQWMGSYIVSSKK